MDQEIIDGMKKRIKSLTENNSMPILHEWVNTLSDFIKALAIEADTNLKKKGLSP